MKADEAGQILGMLTAGFHRESLEEGTVELWLGVIQPLDADVASRVALEWVKSQDRFPTISQFRHAYHGERRRDQSTEASVNETPVDITELACPEWVQRWLRRFKVVSAIDDPRRRAAFKDWRVFPEQIVGESKYVDDPRFTRAEAAELGVMPEDAWVDSAQPGGVS